MKCAVIFTRKNAVKFLQFQNLKIALVRKMYDTVFHACRSITKVPAI